MAAKLGHVELLECLIEKGAFVNATDYHECTALHLACQGDQVDCSLLLLMQSADVNVQGSKAEAHVLHGLSTLEQPCCCTSCTLRWFKLSSCGRKLGSPCNLLLLLLQTTMAVRRYITAQREGTSGVQRCWRGRRRRRFASIL